MYEKMFFIGGFPRSGSTLLGSILCQNEKIHMEGKSPVVQLMWDAQDCINRCGKILISNNKNNFEYSYMSQIPKIYYENNNREIVIDKNPWWTNIKNIELIYKYIDKDFKMIVLYRNPVEVLKSYARVYKKNKKNLDLPLIEILPELLHNYKDFIYLLENNNLNNFLFIDYNDLINDTSTKIDQIYDFLQIDNFNHNLQKIDKYYLKTESFYGLNGLYEVMPKIQKREYDIEIDDTSYHICSEMNNTIISYKELGLC